MNRDGLGKVRRAELVARLTRLEQMISEQAARAEFIRQKGWDARTADRRLERLVDSHQLYLRSLDHLLGERPHEPPTTGGTSDGLVRSPGANRRRGAAST
jgi:hypothetical protein